MDEKLSSLQNDPATMTTICDNIANGGSLTDLCQVWGVPYYAMAKWIYLHRDRARLYHAAIDAREEWMVQRLLSELKALAFVDLSKVYDENHAIIPSELWPDDVKRAIAGLEVSETFDMEGNKKVHTGFLKKVKFYDKLKSIDLLGKQLGMFVQRHEVNAKITLEDLIAGSKENEQSIPRFTDEQSVN